MTDLSTEDISKCANSNMTFTICDHLETTKNIPRRKGQKCQKLDTLGNWILISAPNNWISFYLCDYSKKTQLISKYYWVMENECTNLWIYELFVDISHILRCLLLEVYYALYQLCHFFLNHCKLLSKRRKLWPKLEIMFKWFAQQYQKKLVALLPHQ